MDRCVPKVNIIIMCGIFNYCFYFYLSCLDIGYKVYIGFPPNYNKDLEVLRLYLSTNQIDATEFSIHTLEGFHLRDTVKINQSTEIEVPLEFEVQTPEQRYKGIKITTSNDKPIVVYGLSYRSGSSGIFAALPCTPQDVTEYEYYGVTFDGFISNSLSAYVLFIGCENNTEIKVGSSTIYLNEMETYIIPRFIWFDRNQSYFKQTNFLHLWSPERKCSSWS